MEVATEEAGVERRRRVRRGVSGALAASGPNWLFQDVCVPIARIPEVLLAVEAIARRHDLRIPVVAHAGDGNLHPSILFDRSAGEEERAHLAEADVLRAALAVGGTISAEHGIGFLKLPWLREDLDAVAIDEMQTIKRALDPRGFSTPASCCRSRRPQCAAEAPERSASPAGGSRTSAPCAAHRRRERGRCRRVLTST